MARAYYSTVFEQPAPEVWKIVRDFNNYPVWVGGAGESRIEDGDRAFAEWWATFDCDTPRQDELAGTLRGSFGKWLESLRGTLVSRPSGLPEAAMDKVGGGSPAVSG
jgi:hypothetical protein